MPYVPFQSVHMGSYTGWFAKSVYPNTHLKQALIRTTTALALMQ